MSDPTRTRAVIEEMRARLLDLSGRNRLLNFRATATNSLRIVDELPDQLFEGLLEGERFTFAAVPEPSPTELEHWHAEREGVPRAEIARRETALKRPAPEQWADHRGMAVSYDLPVEQGDERPERHRDRRIQTVLYPDQLDRRLRKLRGDAVTAIEETGTNYLHLAFGFLQWHEATADRTGAKGGGLAPLLLLPVEIERKRTKGGAHSYTLSYSGEDLQPNLSLQKKLADQFALDLPGFDETVRPEAYFRAIRELVADKPGWSVRRFATLSLFQFGKLLIYRDLAPGAWPDGEEPAEHAIVARLATGATPEGPSFEAPPTPEPRRLDVDLDLIERADSSQAGAIAAALSGTSMVIQGPPGTGKSQTITNLIAGALAGGRTVLFVSEKLAALDVVRARLDAAGLGAFVLELHSAKTRKAALMADLRQRLEATSAFPPPRPRPPPMPISGAPATGPRPSTTPWRVRSAAPGSPSRRPFSMPVACAWRSAISAPTNSP